jgi:DNA primase
MTTAQILSHLKCVSERSGGWMSSCPAHDDHDPSLSIKENPNGDTLVHCFTGCSATEIMQALGLDLPDLFASNSTAQGVVTPPNRVQPCNR